MLVDLTKKKNHQEKLINKICIQTRIELAFVHMIFNIFNIGNPTETIKMLLELRLLNKTATVSLWMKWRMRSTNQNNKDDSEIENTYFSCRGFMFGSQNPTRWLTMVCNSKTWGSDTFWGYLLLCACDAHAHTHTHELKIRFKNIPKREKIRKTYRKR